MQENTQNNTEISARILQLIEFLNLKPNSFAKELGYGRSQTIYDILSGKSNPSFDFFNRLYNTEYSDIINPDWLLTGKGEMQRAAETALPAKRNLIPLYSDVSTMGGNTGVVANGTGNHLTELIDSGDWFPGATAAIRHYGDSMAEYPSGSILALKAVGEIPRGFVLGQNYVVEYGEDYNRVTKRIQKKGDTYIAYSTNEDTYKDGTLIHQPFELYSIHKAWRVVGCVIKTESSRGIIPVGK